jgi:flagellar hook-basal body complex protein FliE
LRTSLGKRRGYTVSETEVAVETMVAVRNKVIEAYQAIMAMPI